MPRVSFLICSHQAPEGLFDVLRSILAQGGLDQAEIVVVNNGFPEESERRILETVGGKVAFSLVREPTPGLGFARAAGFRAIRGRHLVMLDDDNTLGDGFLATLLEITAQHPELGGICSKIMPVWEREPASWLVEYGVGCLSYNATAKYKQAIGDQWYPPEDFAKVRRPPGGGMIVHRRIAEHYLEVARDEGRIGLDRKPDVLAGGQDDDIWGQIQPLGLPLYYSDRLRAYHVIPRYRTEMKYLLRLRYQTAYTYALLDAYRRPGNTSGALFEIRQIAYWFLVLGRESIRRGQAWQACLLNWAWKVGESSARLRSGDGRGLDRDALREPPTA